MPADIEAMFQEVLSAIEKGEKARARDLLTRLLKIDQENPRNWIWMSAVVDTPKERVYCLKEALRRDPQNEAAQRGLLLAGALPSGEEPTPAPIFRRNWQAAMFPSNMEKIGMPQSRKQIAIYAGSGLVLIALLVLGIFGSRWFKMGPSTAGIGPQKYPTMTLEPTLSPTAGKPTLAVTGTPVPLWMLLSATFTPTPLYVNTPHPRNEAYRSAMRSYERGDWPGTLNYIQQVATAEPGSADMLYYIGEMYRFQGNDKDALTAYIQALDVSPQFAPAHLGIARAMIHQNPDVFKEAEINLRDALESDPNLFEAYLELARLYLQNDDAGSALKVLDKGAPLLGSSPLYHFYLAQAQLMDGKPEAALASAQEANHLDPTMLESYRLLGQILQQTGDMSGSIKALETYLNYSDEDAEVLVWLGKAYLGQKNTDRAMEYFNSALKLNPDLPDIYIQRGLLFLDRNRPEDAQSALDDFTTALKNQSSSFAANLGKGRAQLLLGYNGDAYMQISRSEGFAKDDADKAQVYYWRALSLEALNDKTPDPKALIAAVRDWKALLELPADSYPKEWAQTAQKHISTLSTATPTPKVTTTLTPTRTPVPSKTSAGKTATP